MILKFGAVSHAVCIHTGQLFISYERILMNWLNTQQTFSASVLSEMKGARTCLLVNSLTILQRFTDGLKMQKDQIDCIESFLYWRIIVTVSLDLKSRQNAFSNITFQFTFIGY